MTFGELVLSCVGGYCIKHRLPKREYAPPLYGGRCPLCHTEERIKADEAYETYEQLVAKRRKEFGL